MSCEEKSKKWELKINVRIVKNNYLVGCRDGWLVGREIG